MKSEKITPFGGIFPIMDEFNRVLGEIVDSTLGLRSKLIGYQYTASALAVGHRMSAATLR